MQSDSSSFREKESRLQYKLNSGPQFINVLLYIYMCIHIYIYMYTHIYIYIHICRKR